MNQIAYEKIQQHYDQPAGVSRCSFPFFWLIRGGKIVRAVSESQMPESMICRHSDHFHGTLRGKTSELQPKKMCWKKKKCLPCTIFLLLTIQTLYEAVERSASGHTSFLTTVGKKLKKDRYFKLPFHNMCTSALMCYFFSMFLGKN